MNLNPLSHIFAKDDRELTPEELDAADLEAKRHRAEITRQNVRNGPVSWRIGQTEPSGKTRRRKARDKAAFERKINKRHRRDFMAKQRETATLRGHLVILGVVECRNESVDFTEAQRAASATWVVGKYGTRGDDGQIVFHDNLFAEALEAARADLLKRYGVAAA